jgi:hypothetical protein
MGSHFGSESHVDIIGVAPSMDIDPELRKIRAAAFSLEFEQPLLEVA